MAIEVVSFDSPEFINVKADTLASVRELILWQDSIPSVFEFTRFESEVTERVQREWWQLLSADKGFNAMRSTFDDADVTLNILRIYVEGNEVFLDCMLESADDCEDCVIELRAA